MIKVKGKQAMVCANKPTYQQYLYEKEKRVDGSIQIKTKQESTLTDTI